MLPLWLLGSNIAHSLSPTFQNAGLLAMGLPAVYALHPVDGSDVDGAFAAAQASCAGINITAPLKLHAARYFAPALNDDARMLEAVNTVVFRDGEPTLAANTDVDGLVVAWRRAAIGLDGRRVAVVGAGGAARAVALAALQAGASGLAIHVRDRARADGLLRVCARIGLPAAVHATPSAASLTVIAATEVDDVDACLDDTLQTPGVVHDLRYGPVAIATRNAALRKGHLFLDGTTLLLGQGMAALALFTMTPLSVAAQVAMTQALAVALQQGRGAVPHLCLKAGAQ